jgi:hypothetical protein
MNASTENTMRVLARTILASDDPDSCKLCLDGLESYIALQLDGEDYRAELPDVAEHLDGCVVCSQSYAILYTSLSAEKAQVLPQPSVIPEPDLSFLLATPKTLDPIRQAIRQLGNHLQLSFSQGLLELIQRPNQGQLAFRDIENTPLFSVEIPSPSDQVDRLAISIYPDDERDAYVLVQVSISLPNRIWPNLGGITVQMAAAGNTHQETTDQWGEASFEAIPRSALPDLRVEIQTS